MSIKDIIYKEFYTQIKQELYNELREELKQEILKELVSDVSNLQKQIDEINNKLIPHKGEKFYQKHLEKILGATHQRTKHGITDITTEDAIYEIKKWINYKQCFGQLKSYSIGNSNKKLCAVFFGEIKEERKKGIVDLFTENNIEVYEFVDNCDMVKIDNCIEKIYQETENNEKDKFVRWLDKNICYKQDSILFSRDIYNSLFQSLGIFKLNNNKKAQIKYIIEEWIKQKFKNVNHIYQDTTFNSQKYKGWLHLSFVE
jgi:hypothetical protein